MGCEREHNLKARASICAAVLLSFSLIAQGQERDELEPVSRPKRTGNRGDGPHPRSFRPGFERSVENSCPARAIVSGHPGVTVSSSRPMTAARSETAGTSALHGDGRILLHRAREH